MKLIETMLQHVAQTSKTPTRYFYQSDRGGRGDAPSGESLKVEDQPLLDKIEARQKRYGNSWYRVARLVARAAARNFQVDFPIGEPVWKDPQSEYRSVLLEQALQMSELGIPLRFIVKHLGFSREETEELLTLAEQAEQEQEQEGQETTDGETDNRGQETDQNV